MLDELACARADASVEAKGERQLGRPAAETHACFHRMFPFEGNLNTNSAQNELSALLLLHNDTATTSSSFAWALAVVLMCMRHKQLFATAAVNISSQSFATDSSRHELDLVYMYSNTQAND